MDSKQQDEQQSRMSHSQYRQQQHQTEQPNEAAKNTTDRPYSREVVTSQHHDEAVAEETARLERHLNITIIALIIAIIIVYLILFHVG